MPIESEHRLLTTKEAAELLRIKEQSLRALRLHGGARSPRFCKVGARVLYAVSDLEEYLARRTFNSTSEAKVALSAEKVGQS